MLLNPTDENTCCKICLAVTGVIELIVIILWIIGGVVVAYPPNGSKLNSC